MNRLARYIELDREEKKLKSEKEQLRPYINKLLRRAKRQEILIHGISYYEKESVKFNEDELFEWVKTQCHDPEVNEEGDLVFDDYGEPVLVFNQEKFNKLTRLTIDLDRLEQAVAQGLISMEFLPERCYTVTKSPTVKVDHKRLKDA